MLSLPLTADESCLLRSLITKRQTELRQQLRKEKQDRLAVIPRGNIGITRGIEADYRVKEIVGLERAKLDSLEEVLANARKGWSDELVQALSHHISAKLDSAQAGLAKWASTGECQSRRFDGFRLRTLEAFTAMRNELFVDLNTRVYANKVDRASMASARGEIDEATRAQIAEILDAVKRILEEHASLSLSEKSAAEHNLSELSRELAGPKPRATQVLQFLGHISDVATLTSYASRLGELLARYIK